MKLSDGEKLILVMLSDIYKHMGIKGEIDAEFVSSAVNTGNAWGLTWKYPGVFEPEEHERATVSEVVDILDMWSSIETAYSELLADERARVDRVKSPLSKTPRFFGFDGNNESEHIGVASFLIDDLERFSSFKGRDLNSHFPGSLDIHRRMLAVFKPIRSTLDPFGAEKIISVLEAS
ncbi:MAG: YfbU family protein [Methylocella sp.]